MENRHKSGLNQPSQSFKICIEIVGVNLNGCPPNP